MNAKDITDRYGLDDWLAERPEEVRKSDAIAIAQRAALRVLPVWLAEVERSRSRGRVYAALPVLRSLLISGVGQPYASFEVSSPVNVGDAPISAAYAAIAAIEVADAASAGAANPDTYADAAAAVGYAVAAAGLYAGDAAGHAGAEAAAEAAETAAWGAVRTDAEAVEGGRDPRTLPLWPKDPPPVISQAELAGLETLATETRDPNSFWHRWWLAMKRGEPMDWELQRKVAQIADRIWKQGPESVLETIARL